jgi:hypothetical protein
MLVKERNIYPTFLFVGGPKCGSTWIYKALKSHPEVYVPEGKEIFFFDRYYDRGFAWYSSFFAGATNSHKAIGEVCHDYLYSLSAADRIYKDIKDIRLFCCLRNPIDRIWSGFNLKRRNRFAKESFRRTVKEFPSMLSYGEYSKYISYYIQLFGKERFKIFFFDDLKKDPLFFSKQIFHFVGVDPNFENSDLTQKVLPASRSRFGDLPFFAKHISMFIRDLGYPQLIGLFKNSIFYNLLFKQIKESDIDKMSDNDRKWLIDYYSNDIMKLQNILNVDLMHWLK